MAEGTTTEKITEKKPKKPKIPRQPMPEQKPEERIHNFNEVPFGYTEESARVEASRCIQCKKPLCIAGCPVEIDIPAFIQLIVDGDHAAAARKIKETNALPAICGRVCPQEDQCEAVCVLGKKQEPVAIGRLERFVADWEREHGLVRVPERPPATGHKVAVIGAGPAGLTVAGEMAKKGHAVTIFEALHEPGGVLTYGIPEFRLPKDIVRKEIDYLKSLGVEIECNVIVGKLVTIDELFEEGYEAVFIGTGAGAPWFEHLEGENLSGIVSANEFLTRSNLMKAFDPEHADTPILPAKKVAVLGAGNTAMDAARTAVRLGAEEVAIVYRRSRKEMPARIEEIHHAEEEGVKFELLTKPIRYLGDEQGRVTHMECIRMELGEPDDSGRRRPLPIEGSEFLREVDCVIVAFGTNANPVLGQATPNLQLNRWGYIVADEETGRTSIPGVFAGGDIVTGSATVILAMGAGRKAANAMHEYLLSLEGKETSASDEGPAQE